MKTFHRDDSGYRLWVEAHLEAGFVVADKNPKLLHLARCSAWKFNDHAKRYSTKNSKHCAESVADLASQPGLLERLEPCSRCKTANDLKEAQALAGTRDGRHPSRGALIEGWTDDEIVLAWTS